MYFARESVSGKRILEPFLKDFDEIHYVLIRRSGDRNNISGSCFEDRESFYNLIKKHMEVGDILLVAEDDSMIFKKDHIICASMEISNDENKFSQEFFNIYKVSKYSPESTFDFMLSDGFTDALIAYDKKKDCLYVYNRDDNIIAHAYIRGIGFFVHTEMKPLRDAIQVVCHVARDGMNLWENWYGHPLEGRTYREIDLDSGFMRIENL